MKPEIVVERDYDGYFEGLVRSWVERAGELKHHKIIVNAGPWKPYAVSYESNGGILRLDFYSALRTGFGHLSEEEEQEMIKLL